MSTLMLQGDKVTLREWRESDLASLGVLRNDIELQTQLMAQPKPNSVETIRAWLTRRGSQEDAVFFVIAAEDGNAVGYLQVTGIDRFHGHGDLGICIAPSAHGKGYAAEACSLLEGYLTRVLALRKLTLQVLASNARAIAFYRKHGYREIGVMEQQFRAGNDYHDVLIMERRLT